MSGHQLTSQERRPCTFGQSLGRPIVRSISHFFLSTKKNCPVSETQQKILCQSLIFFWSISDFFVHPLLERLTKQNSETDQNFFVQSLRLDNFFWLTKKMRNRPDNWLTKRLTKSTWTPLRCSNQSHGLVYMALLQITMPARPI